MAKFPSGNHVWHERVIQGGRTGIHQGGEGSEAFGKVAHRLGSLLPIHLCHVLVSCHGVQNADDGSEDREGVGAEVDGEEVLRRCQTGGLRLEVV